jgi:hypothetical protein
MQRDPSFTAKKALAVKSAAQADAIEVLSLRALHSVYLLY